ncbi:trifunctional serine/threonine-protein kinase/ATP-binding protein/sensor histidine kinase [Rhizobium ruizarguesonis]|uniref:trifunctional serine/threonine-protein kinase/ATP-binding protein/sensor histidine kinase n=1 Tax=Rhizobium ruizarguesonis TaxID=2081791 RepID=UPI00102FD713|nr:trifunctional serine/threonine-protein kinase/ATP-binding protein/sensor histidine kinase [Rhizobium ruizarguesonis]MBY5897789.1 AAA family ATPase [Rhizobium leguminosarum]TBD27030.1 PAS domain S-box protein [Rhizobium ruizarguesonis]
MEVLWEDGERVLHRERRRGADGKWNPVLVVLSTLEYPTPSSLGRLDHEYALKDELDSAWAVRPLELVREGGRTMLVLEDPGGEPLAGRLGTAMETELFLRLGIGIAAALRGAHQRGLVHKDIKPANILVTGTGAEVRLTSFGIASRLSRERQTHEPPEVVAGTLAYMAPEQTGRMNRSIDSRSDLYALGVTLYEMLTGSLPFSASDPMEWVHCHIARQPTPPNERVADVSPAVSAIVMKLLAKTAEERYQTAGGVEHDLSHCLSQWEMQHRIDAFPLGERDIPDRLLIPEKLYGREHEVEILLTAWDRVVSSGAPELVLVSGYSGIGKSAVVNELHKALAPPRGLFASGKFDQYKRDIPYATLAQAFQSLVRELLAKSDADLALWRETLRETLGPNGRLMVDLVPDLKLIIGDQPPVPELPPQEAQRRFELVFRRFIAVFAQPEHPLALFLDDLQWLDAATLDLLEDLLTRPDLQHLMLVGAYRDNEVTAAHPLMRKLDAIKTAGGKVAEITLAPLTKDDLRQLIADALHCQTDRAAPLAQMMLDKTGGNPFFVRQFLFSLAEEGMLAFDHDAACWSWDLGRIHAKGYTDNVVHLMVGKLERQPPETREALQQFACLGNIADIATLSLVLGIPEEEVAGALWPAVAHELLEGLAGAYRFVHDRVQEAAYSLIPEERRGELHLRIGRLLAANTAPELIDDYVFEIVSQLNRGAALITSTKEREQLAEFNLLAGKRAAASTAYASALNYFVAGTTLLPEDAWERQRQLTFALELNRAECEFHLGALPDAEERLAQLSNRAVCSDDQAAVACLRIDLYAALGQTGRSAAVGLDHVRQHLGIDWAPHPADEEVQREYGRIWSQLGSRAIEELIDLPLMRDPASASTLDILTRLVGAVWHTDANLACMAICLAVNLSLERGNSDGSCYHYVSLGYIAGPRFGDYEAGFRFGQLGCHLVEKHDLKRFQARTYKDFGAHVIPWTRHVRTGRDILRRALEIANQCGDLTFAGYSHVSLNSNLLAAGDPLMEVQRQAEIGLTFAQEVRFQFVIDLASAQLGLVRTLRGLTRKFGSFDDDGFDELEIERRFSENPNLAETCYFVRKLQARFFAGDYEAAVDASLRAQRLPWTSVSHFEETPEHHFYGALARAACCDYAVAEPRARHTEALVAHHRQLQIYAKNCPENFENRAALVGAEIARLEGREIDAVRLYEQAIRSARANGFVHHEALAYELAARFYAQGGFEDFARLYLRNARGCYRRWGADGKVRQLDQLYPDLRGEERVPSPTSTIGAPVEQLDLATVIKISQAVSGEIVLQKLIDTVLRTAVEQAGAERGLLILSRGGESRITAEATTGGETVVVQMCDEIATGTALPQSLLHYVLRTSESVVLDDAIAQNPFSADPYICQHRTRSILCVPLLNQGQLAGVLYLENNLAPRVFAPARIAVLKLLASQAAISLENTRLYRDLAEREARIRRLVKANIIGIVIWDIEGRILEANDAFLRMVGYDREDLASGRLCWTELTPAEWRDRDARAIGELKLIGAVQPFEKEYFRKDGSRLPVLIGGALLEESRNEGVSFVLDLTERRQAEEALRESEGALREALGQLAHANRVATMGQLTASIAHEVNQPLAASLTNAQAALRWLGSHPPNLEEVAQALGRIVDNANRAGDVIGRIRALVKKEPPRKGQFDLNEAIRHVIALTGSEVLRQGVTLQTEFATSLPSVEGDRVQVQQVVLNLIMNAIEAMSGIDAEERELLISTEIAASGGVVVGVRDSGPGMDPQTMDRLFEAFYTTKSSGMGMGLAICRSIIEAHGGQMWAAANDPRGALFLFSLPLQRDETIGAKPADEMAVLGNCVGPTPG